MRKTVRQSVDGRHGRQTDPKKPATDFWITHYAINLIQRVHRHFGICVEKPENIAACGVSSDVHLLRAAALAASKDLIAEAMGQLLCAICARAIDDNDFRPRSPLSQVREKRAYQ